MLRHRHQDELVDLRRVAFNATGTLLRLKHHAQPRAVQRYRLWLGLCVQCPPLGHHLLRLLPPTLTRDRMVVVHLPARVLHLFPACGQRGAPLAQDGPVALGPLVPAQLPVPAQLLAQLVLVRGEQRSCGVATLLRHPLQQLAARLVRVGARARARARARGLGFRLGILCSSLREHALLRSLACSLSSAWLRHAATAWRVRRAGAGQGGSWAEGGAQLLGPHLHVLQLVHLRGCIRANLRRSARVVTPIEQRLSSARTGALHRRLYSTGCKPPPPAHGGCGVAACTEPAYRLKILLGGGHAMGNSVRTIVKIEQASMGGCEFHTFTRFPRFGALFTRGVIWRSRGRLAAVSHLSILLSSFYFSQQ